MVRSLDISKFDDFSDEGAEPAELAGWREFKYRNQPIYTGYSRSPSLEYYSATASYSSPEKSRTLPDSTHPPPSPLLSSFHSVRDVPIGAVHHVLGACTKIKRLNMSRLHLASDFMIKNSANPSSTQSNSQSSNQSSFEPAYDESTITFVSDVSNSWAWKHSELQAVYANSLLDLIGQLRELETFTARDTRWLSTTRVKRFMKEAQRAGTGVRGLRLVDFTDSGMESGLPWAIKGTREKVESIVGEMRDVLGERTIS